MWSRLRFVGRVRFVGWLRWRRTALGRWRPVGGLLLGWGWSVGRLGRSVLRSTWNHNRAWLYWQRKGDGDRITWMWLRRWVV